MADFNLTQTDQQVQNILNDAQGAMGASAQTTLTTEYVMLKDTNGVYHKILKSSFTEAIRDVLAGLLVNNDKGTTISQIAAIASGDFGSITPANLASVLDIFLGAIRKGNIESTVDFNTFTPNTLSFSWNSANDYATYHAPFSGSLAVFTLDWGSGYMAQIAFCLTEKGIASRFTNQGTGSWREWIYHVSK